MKILATIRITTTRAMHFSFLTKKPTSSEVLTAYLMQCNEPPWTSYFVKYSSVKDDQFGKNTMSAVRAGCNTVDPAYGDSSHNQRTCHIVLLAS
ncbi:Uncharacterized protein OBRU01_24243 [Operophtera brumata]|uniref:Uncharacterized protein n=1 Tax=Operophtera brumata TaxID=104452 RepID=A0A0L7KMC8_OPEBR|nr:Uncharacterized protein OBRU01_24243 [Operophtera brumata]